jgi:hypothetical protein
MVNKPLKESFLVEELKAFPWPKPLCPDLGKKRDNDYKSVPER